MKKRIRGRGVGASGASVEPLEGRVLLAAVAWTGGGDGTNWHDPNNWSNNAIPGAADDVTIDVAANPTIVYSNTAGNRTINSLLSREAINFTGGRLTLLTTATMEAATTLNGGTLEGGTWTFDGISLLFSNSGNNRLNGPITVNGDLDRAGASGVLTIAGGLTLNGVLTIRGLDTVDFSGTQTFSNGTITFANDNSNSHNLRVAGPDGSTLTIAANATVNGGSPSNSATIASTGTGTQALVNLGTINATTGTGIFISVEDLTNLGTVRATAGTLRITSNAWTSENGSLGTNGGTLDIGGAVTTVALGLPNFSRVGGTVNVIGTIDNTGNTLTLNAQTGTFILNGGTITAGTVALTDGSQLLFSNSGNNRLNGPITVNGDLDRAGASGVLTIAGGLTLNGVLTIRGLDTVDFSGTQTFSNGTITFANDNSNSHNLRVAGPDGSTLTIAANATVNGGSPSNSATIASTGTGTQALVNLGTINATTGTGIFISVEDLTNLGTVRATAGTLRIDLPGSDTTWTNDGTLSAAPGAKVEVVDNLVLSATSLVGIEVQGAGAANHGVIASTGAMTISGGYTAAYVGGYVPAEGTFFDVITATGGRAGEFTSTALPTAPPTDKTVLIYEGTRVRMLSTDLADLNLDGTTNSLDFVLFLNWYTSLDPRADTNGDGNINSLDFILYLNRFTDG
ncbi:MAG: hypothetical protein KJZ54_04195 [Phycisphaerales bacterium]|nr:hypothetical protein [Phycisphaerales bacterium]